MIGFGKGGWRTNTLNRIVDLTAVVLITQPEIGNPRRRVARVEEQASPAAADHPAGLQAARELALADGPGRTGVGIDFIPDAAVSAEWTAAPGAVGEVRTRIRAGWKTGAPAAGR